MYFVCENKHYFMIFCNNIYFYLNDGLKYLFEASSGFFELRSNSGTLFKIEDGKIKLENGEVLTFILKYESVIYCNSDKISGGEIVNFRKDGFDKKPIAEGSYAFIYESFTNNPELLERVLKFSEDQILLPDNLKRKLNPFCIFPIKSKISNNIAIQTMKRGIQIKKCKSLLWRDADFYSAIRNLFIGNVVFEKNKFVHGDISSSNIVFHETGFKFIDFDLHFMAGQPKQNSILFSNFQHTVPFYLGVSFIKYYELLEGETPKNLRRLNDNFRNISLYRNYLYEVLPASPAVFFAMDFDFSRIDLLIKKAELIEESNTQEEIHMFLSSYQLCLTFLEIACLLHRYTDKIFIFCKEALLLNEGNRLKSALEILTLFDKLFKSEKRKITDIDSSDLSINSLFEEHISKDQKIDEN